MGVAFVDCASRLWSEKQTHRRTKARRRRFSLTPCFSKELVSPQGRNCFESFPRSRTNRRNGLRQQAVCFARWKSGVQETVDRLVECVMAYSFTMDCFALSAAFCQ